MPIPVVCPKCGTKSNAPDNAAGKRLRCRCGEAIAIPATSPSQANAPQSASARGSLFDVLTDRDFQQTQVNPYAVTEKSSTSDASALRTYLRDEDKKTGKDKKRSQNAVNLDPSALANAESTRRQYLNHEASLKSIGILYLIGAGISGSIGLSILGRGVAALTGSAPIEGEDPLIGLPMPLFLIVIGLSTIGASWLQGYAGRSMRTLDPAGKPAIMILAGFGLLGFPLGTLLSAYILYLVTSSKGNYVMSDEYHAIIQATPHVKYKTPIVAWIVLILLIIVVLLAVIAIVIAFANRRS